MRSIKDRKEIIQLIVQKMEQHYEDKFTYALPEWAMLSAKPEIVSIITVHGAEGIAITKQRVEFDVNFSDRNSIIHYTDYLSNQMNIEHEILGYIIFFDKNIYAKKDPNYKKDLTAFEQSELDNYPKSKTDISILMLNKAFQEIKSFDNNIDNNTYVT